MKKLLKHSIASCVRKIASWKWWFVGGLVFLAFLTVGIWQWGYRFEISPTMPSPGIFDRNGNTLGEILNSENQRYVEIWTDEFPRLLTDGLVQLEDRDFYDHIGVSSSGIIRSMLNNLKVITGIYPDGTLQGGSTLTMGLARNLLGINRKRTVSGKIQEIVLAIRLEIRYSKSEILSAYLNRVHFGRLAIGIGSASEAYFGKPLWALTPAEIIALLSLIKNPTAYDPVKEPEAFTKRIHLVVFTLEQTGIVTPWEAKNILEEPLIWTRPKTELPYVSDFIKSIGKQGAYRILSPEEIEIIQKNISDGLPIVTSIDLGLTRKITHIAEAIRTSLQYRNVSDYSVLLVDRKNMKVRVLIGGANYSWNAGQVNVIFAPRQVGSTMKPFTYLLGIVNHKHAMSDTILDAPVGYLTADGNPYEPKNYSLRYRGTITLAEALAGSINVPAVKMAQEVGVATLLKFVQSLGVTSLQESADYYGLALTLGVGEINLWELLRAYTIFADEGKLHDFSFLESTSPKDGKYIAPPEAISQIVETLSSHIYKSEEFPLGSAMDFGEGKVFVKTGTSRNFRDNYAIGFTENYLIWVWTGNKDGANMRGVSGATGAWEIFAEIVNELDETTGSVISKSVPIKKLPGVSNTIAKKSITISTPLNGTKYLIDQNTPLERQSITVKYWTENSYQNIRISLIPQFWSREKQEIAWGKILIGKLVRGQYEVRVEGALGGNVDTVSSYFEVE